MAFKMNPRCGDHIKTGKGIPMIFKQDNSETDKKVLKEAKRGARAVAKSQFKFAKADAKFDRAENNISRRQTREAIKGAREDYRDAKKEIKKYTDY